MVMYEKARTTVRTKQGSSEEFEVNVGVHQGSVLSPLLFVAVMEVVTRKLRERAYHGNYCMQMIWF